MQRMRRRRGVSFAVATVALVGLAACGSSPTEEGDQGSAPTGANSKLQEVYAQLEGLEGQARTDKLVELAQAEESEGAFTVYFTINEAPTWIDEFEKKYDLTVEATEGSPDDVLARTMQEAQAGFTEGADFVENNEMQMTVLDQQLNLFEPLQSPALDNVDPSYVRDYDKFFPIYAVSYAVAWNPKTVATPPTSWDELLGVQNGLVLEVTDWPWFATLIENWMVPKLGMTEDAAVEMFKTAATKASAVSGHTLMVQLVASGEYEIAPSAYQGRVQQLHDDDGAPLAWEPALEPMILRREGAGIVKTTDRPATAVLFSEHLLTRVQDLMDPDELLAVRADLQTQSPLAGYTVLPENAKSLVENQDRWQELYNQVLREVSGPVRES